MKTDIIYRHLRDSGFRLSIDSRTVSGGEVFFALKGENFDGNSFAGDALDKGAEIAIIDDPLYQAPNTLIVDNVLEELQAVAIKHRDTLHIPVLAISGSNGKTTTKEILARVLANDYKLHYTRGNLNNHIGVPLTILACPPDAGFMIVELGANHVGEIAGLCSIARPDHGLITNIGKAHLGEFGSLDDVVKAKSELYDYLEQENACVFYNDENELLKRLLAQRNVKKIPYSRPGDHSLTVKELKHDPQLEVLAAIDGEDYILKTNLFGLYNLENIIAACSVGLYFNVSPLIMQRALELYMPDNNRSQVYNTGKNTLICDSYNANPDSMSGVIASFRQYPGNNKTLILGDMFELGKYETEEHEKILQELSGMEDINILLVGEVFHSLAHKYNMPSFKSREHLMKYLLDTPVRDSLILVKASRALGLEKIYGLL
ncbi:MAG: UDP-N-acetylmuramoyl-tripeptide--D-alanyl-D-alanine ligase [Bacteroidales bacterium]|nr:UDP-N-acetylmuramoyl-tripeptide--D-alanyl-D-alanine ligase [Bacteroidales bacterium]